MVSDRFTFFCCVWIQITRLSSSFLNHDTYNLCGLLINQLCVNQLIMAAAVVLLTATAAVDSYIYYCSECTSTQYLYITCAVSCDRHLSFRDEKFAAFTVVYWFSAPCYGDSPGLSVLTLRHGGGFRFRKHMGSMRYQSADVALLIRSIPITGLTRLIRTWLIRRWDLSQSIVSSLGMISKDITITSCSHSNSHLIWSKTLPTNDFELTVPDLYFHT